jgi:hypothetical protein
MDTLVHAAVELTVTVLLFPSINTMSPATGTLAPAPPPENVDQVFMLDQLPDATE